MPDYLIIGAGVAGMTAAEAIRSRDSEGRVLVLGEEDAPFYYRVRLPDFVAGVVDEAALWVKKPAWYAERRIELRQGTRAVAADPARRLVRTDRGEEIGFDRLLLAAGGRAFRPPMTGGERPGVFALRALADARAIKELVRSLPEDERRAVCVGGGLLGLEAGNALRRLGLAVTVVELFPRLLPRQLDAAGAAVLQSVLEGLGFSFRLGAKTEALRGEGEAGPVRDVLLADGQVLPAGLVVVSAGVRSNLDLAGDLGLTVNRGVVADDHLRAGPAVWVAGDVAEAGGVVYGTWTAGLEQGRVAGANMAGGDVLYKGTLMANTLKVAGVSVASAGEIDAEGTGDSLSRREGGLYRKLVFEDDRLVGCLMVGDARGFTVLTRFMAEKRSVAARREDLLDPGFDFSTL